MDVCVMLSCLPGLNHSNVFCEVPHNYICFAHIEFIEKISHMTDVLLFLEVASFYHISSSSIKKITHVETFTLQQS